MKLRITRDYRGYFPEVYSTGSTYRDPGWRRIEKLDKYPYYRIHEEDSINYHTNEMVIESLFAAEEIIQGYYNWHKRMEGVEVVWSDEYK